MYFNRLSTITQVLSVEPRSGIEPETSSLPWMRSTTELPGLKRRQTILGYPTPPSKYVEWSMLAI